MMIILSHRVTAGRIGAVLALAMLTSACGSGGSPAASASSLQKTCDQVSAALSDGPDPDADPVGYAEAQLGPLQQIHTSDSALGTAISALDKAYRGFYASDGASGAAKAAVTAASKRVNSFCPGAAS
jgi:hypothetical protein